MYYTCTVGASREELDDVRMKGGLVIGGQDIVPFLHEQGLALRSFRRLKWYHPPGSADHTYTTTQIQIIPSRARGMFLPTPPMLTTSSQHFPWEAARVLMLQAGIDLSILRSNVQPETAAEIAASIGGPVDRLLLESNSEDFVSIMKVSSA